MSYTLCVTTELIIVVWDIIESYIEFLQLSEEFLIHYFVQSLCLFPLFYILGKVFPLDLSKYFN